MRALQCCLIASVRPNFATQNLPQGEAGKVFFAMVPRPVQQRGWRCGDLVGWKSCACQGVGLGMTASAQSVIRPRRSWLTKGPVSLANLVANAGGYLAVGLTRKSPRKSNMFRKICGTNVRDCTAMQVGAAAGKMWRRAMTCSSRHRTDRRLSMASMWLCWKENHPLNPCGSQGWRKEGEGGERREVLPQDMTASGVDCREDGDDVLVDHSAGLQVA